MTIQDLRPGQPVALEVVWGEQTYEVQTTVMGSNDIGLLIKPVEYKGVILDFEAGHFKDMNFSIHCIEEKTGQRRVWRNVHIKVITYYAKSYYAVSVMSFGKNAQSSERRKNTRMKIDANGAIVTGGDKEDVPVIVHDLSDVGISFFVDNDYEIPSGVLKVKFKDTARKNEFDLRVDCSVVRHFHKDGRKFYGCKIVETNKNMLTYICLKRMEGK